MRNIELVKRELRVFYKPCELCKQKGRRTRAKRVRQLPAGRYQLLCDDCFIDMIRTGNTDIIEYR